MAPNLFAPVVENADHRFDAGRGQERRKCTDKFGCFSVVQRFLRFEQGVFLDGYDDAGSRERGTHWLLSKLDESLRSPEAA
jgi:hypothetical protein